MLEVLIEHKILSKTTSRLIADYCERWDVSPYIGILETHVLSESVLADALARFSRLPRVHELNTMQISQSAVALVSYRTAIESFAVPLNFLDETKLEVAIANPYNDKVKQRLLEEVGNEIIWVVGERTDILRAIERFYPIDVKIPSLKL